MKIQTIKIKNIEHLGAEIKVIESSGYKRCKRGENPSLKVIFQETDYYKQQKTVYFKPTGNRLSGLKDDFDSSIG